MPNCWNCDNPVLIEAGKLIYICDCGVECDFTPYIPLTETQIKEEIMPFENESPTKGGSYLKLPKEGESYDFSVHGAIIKIEKVENIDHKKGKFNFMKKTTQELPSGKLVKVDEDCGYYYLITFDDTSKLSISSWSPFYALKEAGVTEGDTLNIVNHKGKGIWEVDKI